MGKFKQKIMTAIMVFCMLLSVLPISVFAEDAVAQLKDTGSAAKIASTRTVNVYPNKVTSKINKNIYGMHIPAWNETLFDNNNINPRMLKNLKEAGISFLVYPGGGFGYDFIWNKLNSPSEINTDEFIKLSRQLNATTKISVNPNASPELAAKWIKYVNKDLKANVKYWEIADEPYLTMSADEFVKTMNKFVPIMKKADPSIKIIANVPATNEAFTKEVIEKAGRYIDVYSIHDFPLFPSKEVDPSSPYDESNKQLFYKDLLGSPQKLHDQLKNVREWVKQLYPKKTVEYQIGSFAPVNWGPEDWTVNALPDALWTADMLGTFAEEKVTGAAYWALMNPYPPAQGDFGMFSPDMKPYVSYYPYVLYNKHFGNTMVKNETDVKDISVYTSLSNDCKNLYIMLINKSPDKNYNLRFDLDKFKPSGDAAAWILDGPVNADNPTNYGLRKEKLNNISKEFNYKVGPYSVTAIEIPRNGSKLDLTDTPNLALNKPTSSSSTALNTDSKYYKTYDYLSDKATDGDLKTRWASKVFQKENEWFSIDLGSTQKFNQIKINWEYWPAAYDIKISNDGKDWTKIADRSLAIKEKPEPQPIDVLNLGKTIEARYMRIDMTKRPDKSGAKAGCSQWTPDAYSIWELGIYLR